MPLKVLGDRVLVKPDAAQQMERGIYLPEAAQQKPQRGTVMSVGEGRWLKYGTLVPPDVAVGDRVLYGKYGGTEVTVDGDDMLIMSATSVYALLDD